MDLNVKTDNLMRADQLTTDRKAGKAEAAKRAGEEFESFLIFTVLKEFEKTVHHSKKGYAEQTHMSLVYEKVGDYLAKKGIGIKEMLTKYAERGAKVSAAAADKKSVGGVP